MLISLKKMLSVISVKKKEEPLLPQTVETTAEDLTDQEQDKPEMVVEDNKDKSSGKAKLATTSTKTKKKKEFLDFATSALIMVYRTLWGKFLMLLHCVDGWI